MTRLTVCFKDGRMITGSYELGDALARLAFAEQLPDFESYTLAEEKTQETV